MKWWQSDDQFWAWCDPKIEETRESRDQILIRLISLPPPMYWSSYACVHSVSRRIIHHSVVLWSPTQFFVHTPVLQGAIRLSGTFKPKPDVKSLSLLILILLPNALQIPMIRQINQCTRLSAILLQGQRRIAFSNTGLRATAQPQPSVKLSKRHFSTASDALATTLTKAHSSLLTLSLIIVLVCPNCVCLSILLRWPSLSDSRLSPLFDGDIWLDGNESTINITSIVVSTKFTRESLFRTNCSAPPHFRYRLLFFVASRYGYDRHRKLHRVLKAGYLTACLEEEWKRTHRPSKLRLQKGSQPCYAGALQKGSFGSPPVLSYVILI